MYPEILSKTSTPVTDDKHFGYMLLIDKAPVEEKIMLATGKHTSRYSIITAAGIATLPASELQQQEMFILLCIDPAWNIQYTTQVLLQLRIWNNQLPVIIYSPEYIDELVRCEDLFYYDAYFLLSDDVGEIQQAIDAALSGKFYVTRNIARHYCKHRRTEQQSL